MLSITRSSVGETAKETAGSALQFPLLSRFERVDGFNGLEVDSIRPSERTGGAAKSPLSLKSIVRLVKGKLDKGCLLSSSRPPRLLALPVPLLFVGGTGWNVWAFDFPLVVGDVAGRVSKGFLKAESGQMLPSETPDFDIRNLSAQ